MNETQMYVVWDLGIGGIQTLLIDVANESIKRDKHSKIVFLLFQSRKKRIKSLSSSRIVILEHKSTTTFFWSRFIWLGKQVLYFKPNIILSYSTYLSFLTAVVISTIRLFIKINTNLFIGEQTVVTNYLKSKRFFWKYLTIFSYAKADKIVVPTKKIAKDLIQNFGVKPVSVVVIKNWVVV